MSVAQASTSPLLVNRAQENPGSASRPETTIVRQEGGQALDPSQGELRLAQVGSPSDSSASRPMDIVRHSADGEFGESAAVTAWLGHTPEGQHPDVNARISQYEKGLDYARNWSPETRQAHVLSRAIKNNDHEVSRALLERGAKPDLRFTKTTGKFNLMTPVHAAALKGVSVDQMKLLKEFGADLNVTMGHRSRIARTLDGNYFDGWTPLHLAISQDNLPVARMLISDPSVDLDARTASRESTPLHMAQNKVLASSALPEWREMHEQFKEFVAELEVIISSRQSV